MNTNTKTFCEKIKDIAEASIPTKRIFFFFENEKERKKTLDEQKKKKRTVVSNKGRKSLKKTSGTLTRI